MSIELIEMLASSRSSKIASVICVSLSSKEAVNAGLVSFWPVGFNLFSYQKVLGESDFFRSFWVSIQRGTVPWYITMKGYGLVDSIWGLVLGMGLNAYNLILAVNFFKNLPAELEEAALVDGAEPWKCLVLIFIPLAKPVIATIALFTIVQYWNEFFRGMVLSARQSNYPLQTYIQQLVVTYDFSTMNVEQIAQVQKLNKQSLDAAKIVVAMIPVLAVYPFLQKYFVSGITLGSIKG